MRKNIIDENFVDELCKSGVWDVARVDLGSVNESAEVEDTDEVSARELAEELFENLSDDVIYECIDILHSTLLNEEDSLDEETLTEEESYQLLEDALYEMDEEELDSLLNEAIGVLDEEYDLSEATEEDLYEAVMDYIIERHGRGREGTPKEQEAAKKAGTLHLMPSKRKRGQRGRMGHVHTDDTQSQEAPRREIDDEGNIEAFSQHRRGGDPNEREAAKRASETPEGRRAHSRRAGSGGLYGGGDAAPYVRARLARVQTLKDRRLAKQQAAQAEVRAKKRKEDPRKRDSKPFFKPRSTATTDPATTDPAPTKPAPTKRQTPEEFLGQHGLLPKNWRSGKSAEK